MDREDVGRRASPLLVALAALGSGACTGRAPDHARPDVVLVCIDTLRADHLGCYGYERHETSPRLDALAEESTVFLDASAAADWTKPSVPSILTGLLPAQHGVYDGNLRRDLRVVSDRLPDRATTLAEVFREEGYRTAAFVQNALLRAGEGLEQGFETYEDGAGDARSIRERALRWIDEGDAPAFVYLHLFDAHWPYRVPEEYATRFTDAGTVARFRGDAWLERCERINDGAEVFAEGDRLGMTALYDGAIRFADAELGALFDGLAERGRWGDAIVAVVSDHGEEFGELGPVGHGHGLSEILLAVPWILRVPGREPARVATPVSLVDVFPTLLAAAGIEPPGTSSGVDRGRAPGTESLVLAEHKGPERYERSLRSGDLKVRTTYTRDLRPEPGTWPAAPGERWSVAVAREPDGELRAVRLVRDPDVWRIGAAFSAPLDELDEERVTAGGVTFERSSWEGVRLGAPRESFRPGVRVRVSFATRAGKLVATGVELHERSVDAAPVLTGPIASIEWRSGEVGGSGTLSILGVPVRLTPATVCEGEPRDRYLDRDDVTDFLSGELRATDAVTNATSVVSGASEQPRPEDARSAELAERLRRFGAEHLAGRVWSREDGSEVSSEVLGELEAIGYVE